MRTLLDRIIQRARAREWLPILDYFSPVVFDIVPAREMLQVLTRLLTERGEAEIDKPVLVQQLADWGLPLVLERGQHSDHRAAPEQRGDILLQLYFAQIFRADMSWLDLRHKVFTPVEGGWLWQPQALRWHWSREFIESMRAVYEGFYGGDTQLFQEGLENLDLGHASELFVKHFGGGDQRAVCFCLKEFRSIFHQIFISCKNARTRLHPEFLPFGLYLATLYEHLDTCGGVYDVRAAMMKQSKRE